MARMDFLSFILAGTQLLLIPYFGWGIHILRRRFRFQEELPTPLEAATLLGAWAYCALQVYVLRAWLSHESLAFLFGMLGLVISFAALYGHVLISLLSKAVVDVVAPGPSPGDGPRLGPAEALERQHDYASALQEYLVIARIYPHEPVVLARIAENYARTGQAGEAPDWFARALRLCKTPAQALPIVNRWCDVAEQTPGNAEGGRTALQQFLARFPESSEAALVKERLARTGAATAPDEHAADLEALAEAAALEAASGESPPAPSARIDIEAIEAAAPEARRPAKPKRARTKSSPAAGAPQLIPLDTPAESEPLPVEAPPESGEAEAFTLESMDTPPAPETIEDEPPDATSEPKGGDPGLELEAMDPEEETDGKRG